MLYSSRDLLVSVQLVCVKSGEDVERETPMGSLEAHHAMK